MNGPWQRIVVQAGEDWQVIADESEGGDTWTIYCSHHSGEKVPPNPGTVHDHKRDAEIVRLFKVINPYLPHGSTVVPRGRDTRPAVSDLDIETVEQASALFSAPPSLEERADRTRRIRAMCDEMGIHDLLRDGSRW